MKKWPSLLLLLVFLITGALSGSVQAEETGWFIDVEDDFDYEEDYDEGIDAWDYTIEDFVGVWRDVEDSVNTVTISDSVYGYSILMFFPYMDSYEMLLTGRNEDGDFVFDWEYGDTCCVLEPMGNSFILTIDSVESSEYFSDTSFIFALETREVPVEEDIWNGWFEGDYSTLEYGIEDDRTYMLQAALTAIGFTITDEDGVFGQSTYDAVVYFQQLTGLTADGKAGKKTLTEIESFFDENRNLTRTLFGENSTDDSEYVYTDEPYTVGSYVTFGTYPQTSEGTDFTPIEWLVLDRDGNKVLLLSRYLLDQVDYSDHMGDVTWESSNLRAWMNTVFINRAFTDSQQQSIYTTNVSNVDGMHFLEYNTSGGNDTQDKIFALSLREVGDYLGFGRNLTQAPLTEYVFKERAFTDYDATTSDGMAAGWWYMRSPGATQDAGTFVTAKDSRAGEDISTGRICARPAMWVDVNAEGLSATSVTGAMNNIADFEGTWSVDGDAASCVSIVNENGEVNLSACFVNADKAQPLYKTEFETLRFEAKLFAGVGTDSYLFVTDEVYVGGGFEDSRVAFMLKPTDTAFTLTVYFVEYGVNYEYFEDNSTFSYVRSDSDAQSDISDTDETISPADWLGTYRYDNGDQGELYIVKESDDSEVRGVYVYRRADGEYDSRDFVWSKDDNSTASELFRSTDSVRIFYYLKDDRIVSDYPDGWWADRDYVRVSDVKHRYFEETESPISISYADATVDFKESLFEKSANIYDNELAKLGAMLSCAVEKSEQDIVDLLRTIEVDGYYLRNLWENQIFGYAIAHKEMQINGEDSAVLFVIARGSKEIPEFVMDAMPTKNRFFNYTAYDYAYQFDMKINDGISEYIEAHPDLLDKPLKVFVTGHSLGGAAANLVAATFTLYEWWGNYLSNEDIFAYTYGAIDSIDVKAPIMDGFENIHNIYNFYDTFGPNGWILFTASGNSGEGKFGHIDKFGHPYTTGPLTEMNNHLIENYLNSIVQGEVRCGRYSSK